MHTQIVTMWGDVCELNLLWWSFHNICIYQVITVYTLNLHNVMCQLFPNKSGENNTEPMKTWAKKKARQVEIEC